MKFCGSCHRIRFNHQFLSPTAFECGVCVTRGSYAADHDVAADVTARLEQDEAQARSLMCGMANGIGLGLACWLTVGFIVWAVIYLPVETF